MSTRYCGRCDATETMAIPPLNSCLLKFNTNGGSAIADQVVVDGTRPVKPQNPVKEGYIFTGWYIDSACKTPFDFSKELKADTTVHAGWQEETPDIPDTDPDTPDNGNKISLLVWAIAVPVVIAAGTGAWFLISKKLLIKK
ncbi:MAG: InlB B-repeat-containing protein [Oscillospiraceae bacterium]|nr:InlB B-repeat-containing protein [Oscillospiraceae bacterium]